MDKALRRPYWGQVFENTSLSFRKDAIEKNLLPSVKKIFQKQPHLNSAMVLVAQFWADEASDAVHTHLLFSTNETPRWPHGCSEEDGNSTSGKGKGKGIPDQTEFCWQCGRKEIVSYGGLSLDENGLAILAFQSCCHEYASQESREEEAYLPYAVVRRGKGGTAKSLSLEVEIIGGPIRGWLEDAPIADAEDNEYVPMPKKTPAPTPRKDDDAATKKLFDLVYAADPQDDGPRAVLADHLQQKGDPLGNYIAAALALSKSASPANVAQASELENAHGRNWLGLLSSVTSPEHVKWERGFVRSIAVHIEDAATAKAISHAREWGSIEHLVFLPKSEQPITTQMKSLKSVGPLNAKGLAHLMKARDSLPHLESIHVLLANTKMLETLAELDLPNLKSLVVSSGPGGPGTARTTSGRNPFTGATYEVPPQTTSLAHLGPRMLASMMKSPVWLTNLEELVVTSVDPKTIEEWLGFKELPKNLKTLAFTGLTPAQTAGGFRLRVDVGNKDKGAERVARIDVVSLNGEVSFEALTDMVRVLPKSITQIECIDTRWFKMTDVEIATLTAASGGRAVRRRVSQEAGA